jgi:hypothetical protein|tara:strand:+ start:243 stop:560 length:318 start_codon:yes stop_codon:yes gene_type:complete
MSSKRWARHFMEQNRNNQFRNEQVELYKQLRTIRANSRLFMEYEIKYKYDDEERTAIVDIVDLTKKEIFRLNGPIHQSSDKRILKDEIQKEGLEVAGWKVTDIET